jgi:BlaI family penicillinase repressor
MKSIPRISDSEWEVLGVLWKKSPLSAAQVFDKLRATGWKFRTVRTFLARLQKKGAVGFEEVDGVRAYAPLLEREECVREAGQTFLDRVFEGATAALLVHFAKSKRLGERDLAELEAILAQKRKGK